MFLKTASITHIISKYAKSIFTIGKVHKKFASEDVVGMWVILQDHKSIKSRAGLFLIIIIIIITIIIIIIRLRIRIRIIIRRRQNVFF